MKKIILAGGCFWGVEEFLSRINGVVSTEVGYANGRTENPTYEELLAKFWTIIDPISLNKQGNDVGSQYRTGIYYVEPSDLQDILNSKEELQKSYSKKIVTEVKPLENYYKAEEYHQKYLKKNPNGYCHIKLD